MLEIQWLLAYAGLGAMVGLLAGMFGIGGGGVMVPVLTMLFVAQGFPAEHLVHLALATSMAAIVPTALASLRAHHQHGAVLWPVVVRMTPGILLGTFTATFFASVIAAKPLAIFFSVFMAFVALQLFIDRKPKASRQLPGTVGLSGAGVGIGGISALVAIGGGSLTVPFLAWCNVAVPVAIGTSAAVGLPVALAGALGYLANGWQIPGLPAFTLGFIYWPAVVSIAALSLITAPMGARMAHRLPVKLLKKLFGILSLLLALQMLRTVI
ncbi:MAG: sulfite exporter TauE/SafE family protein [Cellvibrionaceae bacterium]|nr:sulfite exporter TauE/SafE family protein [Cellvibrionaceae bacterium]